MRRKDFLRTKSSRERLSDGPFDTVRGKCGDNEHVEVEVATAQATSISPPPLWRRHFPLTHKLDVRRFSLFSQPPHAGVACL